MARPCSICNLPNVTEINGKLDSGTQLREIAEEFALPYKRVWRHAYHRGGREISRAARGLGLSARQAKKVSDSIIQKQVESFRDAILRTVKPDSLARVLKEGLSAHETKFFQKDGIITDHRDVVAWAERRQYADLTLRAAGELQEKRSDQPVNIQILIQDS